MISAVFLMVLFMSSQWNVDVFRVVTESQDLIYEEWLNPNHCA